MKTIPDSIAPHLAQIAERLWSGRAAVMVGAGFSKNANRDYPNWAQLGDKLYEKAHGKIPAADDKSYISLLKVAEEAEAVIGRPALDALLQSDIPNLGVKPSDLHVRLLNMPWVDVLTTNYDTLLERACSDVIKYRYSYMVNQSDLPNAQKPRIIKLHGSFPAHTPFIITEEDYRRYPETHAPFVNTVRQALLENTLCLIGFSGDDPNFLHWIGWVRDQMGSENVQPIYLISANSFSAAQQQLLAKRKIIVVDMSLCDGVEKNDHKRALDKFFKILEDNDPNRLGWPVSTRDMPYHLFRPKNNKISIDEMALVVNYWREKRLEYPGWIILPHENRKSLHAYTYNWLSDRFDDEVHQLRDGLDIIYFEELVWRIEKCLLPISDDVARCCEKVLNKYDPFHKKIIIDDSVVSIKLAISGNGSFEWADVQSAWLKISLSVLRYYREEGKSEQWKELKNLLDAKRKYLSDEQSENLHYQEYLFLIFNLEFSKARGCLEKWRPTSSQPFWKSIRCSAMAELGQFDGEILLEQSQEALFETRDKSRIDNSLVNYLYFSHEAYQMVSFRFLEQAIEEWSDDASSIEEELMESRFKEGWEASEDFITPEEDWKDLIDKKGWRGKADWKGEKNVEGRQDDWLRYLRLVRSEEKSKKARSLNQRWDELKALRCDPWGEIKLLTSRNATFFDEDKDRLNAYSFLRFFEDIGFPFRIRNTLFESRLVVENFPHLTRDSAFWVRATFFRLGGDLNAINFIFGLDQIYQLSAVACDDLVLTYLVSLESFQSFLEKGKFFDDSCIETRLAGVLPEVISRLCCKCTFPVKERVLAFISRLYSSVHNHKYSNINKLVRELVKSLSESEQYLLFPKLLNVPFPDSLGPRAELEYVSLTQSLTIGDNKESTKSHIQISSGVIEGLLCDALDSVRGRRGLAVTSLMKLFNLNLLDNSQTERFSKALWSCVDSSGFPEDVNFYKFAFLDVPHPVGIDVKSLFKSYVESDDFPMRGNDRGYTVTQGRIPLVYEIIGASTHKDGFWTHNDALNLLGKVILWWEADKKWLQSERGGNGSVESPFGDSKEFHKRLSRIADIVAIAIGPNLRSRIAKKEKAKLLMLLDEMQQEGLCTLEARVACLHVAPEMRGMLIKSIEEALIDSDKGCVVDALKAILLVASNGRLSDLWPKMLDLLIQFIQWTRTFVLAEGIWAICRILKANPAFFPASFKELIGKRLIRLDPESEYGSGNLGVDVNQKILLRKAAVALAVQLDKAYKDKSENLIEAVSLWCDLSESVDEFSEVRNAWVV